MLALTREQVDDRDLLHRVAARSQTARSTCYGDEDLCGESGVIDLHVELEELILRGARDALASHVYAVPHVDELVDVIDDGECVSSWTKYASDLIAWMTSSAL